MTARAANDTTPRDLRKVGYPQDLTASLSVLNAVRRMIATRSRRHDFFVSGLFSDPAWEMLLELYGISLVQRRISVSSLCKVSGVPDSTALRWLQKLVDLKIVERVGDTFDQRRTWVQLTEQGWRAMDGYFAAVIADR